MTNNAINHNRINREAAFLPATTPDDRPAIEIAGVLVFVGIDKTGDLVVSIDLDTADLTVFTDPPILRLNVQGNAVYHTCEDLS